MIHGDPVSCSTEDKRKRDLFHNKRDGDYRSAFNLFVSVIRDGK